MPAKTKSSKKIVVWKRTVSKAKVVAKAFSGTALLSSWVSIPVQVGAHTYQCLFNTDAGSTYTFADAVSYVTALNSSGTTGPGNWGLGTPALLNSIRILGNSTIQAYYGGTNLKVWSNQSGVLSGSVVAIEMGDEDPIVSPQNNSEVSATKSLAMSIFCIKQTS